MSNAEEESEDAARPGGSEPLAQLYLSTSMRSLVRSCVVRLSLQTLVGLVGLLVAGLVIGLTLLGV